MGSITPARKFRMLLHINPTRQRGKRTGSLARALGWYMTFFAAGVICDPDQCAGLAAESRLARLGTRCRTTSGVTGDPKQATFHQVRAVFNRLDDEPGATRRHSKNPPVSPICNFEVALLESRPEGAATCQPRRGEPRLGFPVSAPSGRQKSATPKLAKGVADFPPLAKGVADFPPLAKGG